jgi:hypothetical protein
MTHPRAAMAETVFLLSVHFWLRNDRATVVKKGRRVGRPLSTRAHVQRCCSQPQRAARARALVGTRGGANDTLYCSDQRSNRLGRGVLSLSNDHRSRIRPNFDKIPLCDLLSTLHSVERCRTQRVSCQGLQVISGPSWVYQRGYNQGKTHVFSCPSVESQSHLLTGVRLVNLTQLCQLE